MYTDQHNQYEVPKDETKYRSTYSTLALIQGIISLALAGIIFISTLVIVIFLQNGKIATYLYKAAGIAGLGICGLTLAKAIVTTKQKHIFIKWKVFNWAWFALQMVLPIMILAIPYDASAQYGWDANALPWLVALFIQFAFFGATCLGFKKRASVGGMTYQLSIGMLVLFVFMGIVALMTLIFTGITKLSASKKDWSYANMFLLLPKLLIVGGILSLFAIIFDKLGRDSELSKTIISAVGCGLIIVLSVVLFIFNTREQVINNSVLLLIVSALALIGSILGAIMNGKYLNDTGSYKE